MSLRLERIQRNFLWGSGGEREEDLLDQLGRSVFRESPRRSRAKKIDSVE